MYVESMYVESMYVESALLYNNISNLYDLDKVVKTSWGDSPPLDLGVEGWTQRGLAEVGWELGVLVGRWCSGSRRQGQRD